MIERLSGDPPSPYEGQFGFSRTIRVGGDWVYVGGTTSVDEDGAVVGDSPYEQTVEILRKVRHELARFGATVEQIVQIHIYVTDISRYEEVGRAHGEVFSSIRPLMTMVGVNGLVDPRMLVEIEAVAHLGA